MFSNQVLTSRQKTIGKVSAVSNSFKIKVSVPVNNYESKALQNMTMQRSSIQGSH